MIPGTVSKLSEQSVDAAVVLVPKTDHLLLTGTTTEIATINPPLPGFSSVLFITPLTAGAITTTTSANIAAAVTLVRFRPCPFIYSKKEGKWYPGAVQ